MLIDKKVYYEVSKLQKSPTASKTEIIENLNTWFLMKLIPVIHISFLMYNDLKAFSASFPVVKYAYLASESGINVFWILYLHELFVCTLY